MLSRGDKGQAVTELQERLVALGYALPRWGADGQLGNETLGSLTKFLADHGAGDEEPEVVSDSELALVRQVYKASAAAWPVPVPGRTFYDLRKESDRSNVHGRRAWTQITGITLHQCAVDFGHEKPARWDSLWAQTAASLEGNFFLVHDLVEVVWHGHGFNLGDVGLELEGLYAGRAGHPDGSAKPQTPTPELIESGKGGVRYICAEVKRHGGLVRFLHAHRQSKDSRRADPGQELWQAIAIPMMAELNLSDGGPGFKIGSGRTIPEAWNPAYRGNVY